MADRSGSPILELLFVFVLVFVAQAVSALADMVGGLFVLTPPVTDNPWTVVTSVYAHAGPGHLLSNAVALVLFGWPVARATTRLRFHLFFVLTGSIAGVAQVVLSDILASLPVIVFSATRGVLGASGAVFALLGYLLASNRLSSTLAGIARVPAWVSLIVFAGIAGAVTLLTAAPGIALIAHFTGLFVGLIAGRLRVLNVEREQRAPRSNRV
jgi:membrane associated rhomboid family serine protease